MTWSLFGWVIIGLSALLLLGTGILLKDRFDYSVRRMASIQALINARTAALERGQQMGVTLGHHLWAWPYHGLGLYPLVVLPTLTDPETMVDGSQGLYGSDGSLILFARQIISGRYREGYSEDLASPGAYVNLPGPTSLSFTAGLMSELCMYPYSSLLLMGSYGPESSLWAEAALSRGSHVFAAAGSLASQAVLYLIVRDILLGEEVFMLPGLLAPAVKHRAGWLTEDVLRIVLILALIAGALFKMVGVL